MYSSQGGVEKRLNSFWLQILVLISSHGRPVFLFLLHINCLILLWTRTIPIISAWKNLNCTFPIPLPYVLPPSKYQVIDISCAAGRTEHKPGLSIIINEDREAVGGGASAVFQGEGVLKWKRGLPQCEPTQGQGEGGCGGGCSVLEESHVVSESGQLLLIWNQWDWGRICGERRRSWVRGGFLNAPSTIHLLTSPPRCSRVAPSPRVLLST